MKSTALQSLIVAAAGVLVLGIIPLEAQDSSDYRVGPRDLIEVRVLEIAELNVERRVTDRGTVDLPIVGELKVGDLTAAEVSSRIESFLTSRFVNRANVSVVIKDFANKPVSIVGAVARPGSLAISARYALLDALSAAGGLAGNAGKRIYVIRRAENGLTDTLEIQRLDLQRDLARWNIPILPSDIVNVPARTLVTVYCSGEVRNPGELEFDSDSRISLLSVIAKAGGLTDRAHKKIKIKRRNAEGEDVDTIVDYKQIIRGKVPDPALFADDVVIVGEAFW